MIIINWILSIIITIHIYFLKLSIKRLKTLVIYLIITYNVQKFYTDLKMKIHDSTRK